MANIVPLQFTFVVKPISVNSAYYRNKVFTKEARQYRDLVFATLLQQSEAITAFTEKAKPMIDNATHMLKFVIEHQVPVKQFYTARGSINQKTLDLDNPNKLIIDFICNTRYMEQEFICSAGKVINLNIDDCYIQQLECKKYPANVDEWVMNVKILLRPIIV